MDIKYTISPDGRSLTGTAEGSVGEMTSTVTWSTPEELVANRANAERSMRTSMERMAAMSAEEAQDYMGKVWKLGKLKVGAMRHSPNDPDNRPYPRVHRSKRGFIVSLGRRAVSVGR